LHESQDWPGSEWSIESPKPTHGLATQQMTIYAKNIRTVPRINARHMGQFRKDGAQLLQQDRCPHGKNTTLTSPSMQTLHSFASFSCLFSSIKLLASEEKQS